MFEFITEISNLSVRGYLVKKTEPDGCSQICSSILKMRCCESLSVMQENLNDITLKDFCDYVCGKRETVIQKDMTKSHGM